MSGFTKPRKQGDVYSEHLAAGVSVAVMLLG